MPTCSAASSPTCGTRPSPCSTRASAPCSSSAACCPRTTAPSSNATWWSASRWSRPAAWRRCARRSSAWRPRRRRSASSSTRRPPGGRRRGVAAEKRDYYAVLEVERSASDADLKKAFRRLALKFHPDQNSEDQHAEERFKEINEAYAVLSDPDKRAAYDRFGHAAFGGPGQWSPAAAGFSSVGDVIEGLFGDLFGKRQKRAAGRDLRYTLEITFQEAAFGTEKSIRFPTRK